MGNRSDAIASLFWKLQNSYGDTFSKVLIYREVARNIMCKRYSAAILTARLDRTVGMKGSFKSIHFILRPINGALPMHIYFVQRVERLCDNVVNAHTNEFLNQAIRKSIIDLLNQSRLHSLIIYSKLHTM